MVIGGEWVKSPISAGEGSPLDRLESGAGVNSDRPGHSKRPEHEGST